MLIRGAEQCRCSYFVILLKYTLIVNLEQSSEVLKFCKDEEESKEEIRSKAKKKGQFVVLSNVYDHLQNVGFSGTGMGRRDFRIKR